MLSIEDADDRLLIGERGGRPEEKVVGVVVDVFDVE
jgi:hypothetical protein